MNVNALVFGLMVVLCGMTLAYGVESKLILINTDVVSDLCAWVVQGLIWLIGSIIELIGGYLVLGSMFYPSAFED